MKYRKHPLRLFLFASLLLCLLTGLTGIADSPEKVDAAPQMQAVYPPSVVISEFRARGAAGANDEFIEIFNASASAVDITDWEVRKSSGCGTSLDDVATVNGAVSLAPGQYYLFAKSGGFSGSADVTYTTTIADDGGIALFNGSTNAATVVDQVGMCSTTAFREGTTLAALTGDVNQSYERKVAGEIRNCTDTNNNAADFVRNASSSNPQMSTSTPVPCLYVTDVDSTTADGTYTTQGTLIDITVTFSASVFVNGTPTLQLETGVTNRTANYIAGSGTNILTFQYSTQLGDFSLDLDYVSSTSLSGSVYDAIGNANLTLPTPGAVNSLGANRDIIISIDDGSPPSIISIKRQNPTSALTNQNSLVFRATFSENILAASIDVADFIIHPNATPPTTTATVTNLTGSGNVYDVTVSGGDLAGFNGNVGLDLSGSATVQDLVGNNVVLPENLSSANDETYILDNTNPGVTVSRAASQADSTGTTPVNFTVVFTEPIVVSTFATTDITQPNAPAAITWTISNPTNDRRTFNLTATAITTTNVVLQPSIAAGVVTDDAGNTNTASINTNNNVTFTDITPPSVTISRASGQAGTTTALPVRFSVVFSEAINVTRFTPSDILQNAATSPASGITWQITDSGDHRNFTILATAVAVGGNITPLIPANAVTDIAGNGNSASTGTATVSYSIPATPTVTPTRTATRTRTPTPVRTATRTRTPTRVPTAVIPQLVAINEFVPRPGHDWNNDGEVNVRDEYIELINHGTINVNLGGWSLDDEANIGSAPYRLPSVTIVPGERIVFYGSETGLLLSDGGDGVRLLRPNGQLIDAYNYTVARYSDQSYCRLPDNGGLDDWNQNCYPTPGLQNSLSSGGISSPNGVDGQSLCPIADTLPEDFVFAECSPYGNNIWRKEFWDDEGWYGEKNIPGIQSRWDVFAD